jgi:hypothetical protein
VGKGYNTKRRHAQKGLADTLVTDYHGRAVCFVSGPPSGLTKTLPAALSELRRVTADAKIMLGFDRGGSYAQVFTHCRAHDVDWITYRRGTLADTTTVPRRYWRVDGAGRTEAVTLADEMITIKDYGPARQLTLLEHDQPVLQVLTSDLTAPAAALLAWLRCRWRIENVFKYLTAHHGMDWLCHYEADLAPDTTPIDNPARKQARDAVKRAQTTLADAQRALTRLLRSDHPVAEINTAIPAAQTAIDTAEAALASAKSQLKTIPAKIPANQHNPNAQRAILRTQRRSLQMVLRLLAGIQRRAVAGRPAQRLPGRQRRVPRHPAPPAPPRRTNHLHTEVDHRGARPTPHTQDHESAAAATRRTQRHPTAHTRRQPPPHLQDQSSLSARADLNRDLHPSSGGLSPIPRRCSESVAPGGAADGNLPRWPRTGSVSGTAICSMAATTAWTGSCSTPTTRWVTTRAGSAPGGDGCTATTSSWTTRT